MKFLELSPLDLGLNDVDMQDADPGPNRSGIIDLRGFTSLSILVEVVNVGTNATAGAATLMWQRYDRDGNAVGEEFSIGTIDTIFDSATANLTFSIHMGSMLQASGVFASADTDVAAAAVAVTADTAHLAPFGRIKLNLNVDTANDAGTSSTGNVRLFAQ